MKSSVSPIPRCSINTLATNELNLFIISNGEVPSEIDIQRVSLPSLTDASIPFLPIHEINKILGFDLFSAIQKTVFLSLCLSPSIDEHALLHVAQIIRDSIDELLTPYLYTNLLLSSQLVQGSANSLQSIFTTILESSEDILSQCIVDSDDSGTVYNSFRNHAEFLLNIIVSIEVYVRLVNMPSIYLAFLKNYLLKYIGYFTHKLFYLWCFDQHVIYSYDDVTRGFGNLFMTKVFPEFEFVNTVKLPSCRKLSDVFLVGFSEAKHGNLFHNSPKSLKTKLLILNCITALIKYQQFGLLRRFSSLLVTILRFSMQHIISKTEVFDCNRSWLRRLRLFFSVCSYLDAVRRSEIDSIHQFHSQVPKIVEEIIYCSSFVSQHHQIQSNPSFLVWHCANRVESLESSPFLYGSLNTVSEHNVQHQMLCNLFCYCNILDALKLVELKLNHQMLSGLNLRIAYNLIRRITKWCTQIQWSDRIVVLSDLQKLIRNQCCFIVEYSLKTQHLEECASSIVFIKSLISLRKSTNSFDDSYGIWLNCVRLLVVHCINNGELGWLCSGMLRTHNEVEKAVTELLCVLAKTTNIQRMCSYGHDVNYYECLIVFLLSKYDFKEAARVSWMYHDRFKSISHSSSREMLLKLWMLSLCLHILYTDRAQDCFLVSNIDFQVISLHCNLRTISLLKLFLSVNLLYSQLQLLDDEKIPLCLISDQLSRKLLQLGCLSRVFSISILHGQFDISTVLATSVTASFRLQSTEFDSESRYLKMLEVETIFNTVAKPFDRRKVQDTILDLLSRFSFQNHNFLVDGSTTFVLCDYNKICHDDVKDYFENKLSSK